MPLTGQRPRAPGTEHRAAADKNHCSTRRHLKPRAPLTVAAAMVSQLTCLVLLGIDPRRYLELLLPLCAGQVTALGKLRLVPLDVAVAKLGELATDCDLNIGIAPENDHGDDDQPTSVNDVLARVGHELAR